MPAVTYPSPRLDKSLHEQIHEILTLYKKYGTHAETKKIAEQFASKMEDKNDELLLLLEITKEALNGGIFSGSKTLAPKLKEFAVEFAKKYKHDFYSETTDENIVKYFVAIFVDNLLRLENKWLSGENLKIAYQRITAFVKTFRERRLSTEELYEHFIFELNQNPILAENEDLRTNLSHFISSHHITKLRESKELRNIIAGFMFHRSLQNISSDLATSAIQYIQYQRGLKTRQLLIGSLGLSYSKLFKLEIDENLFDVLSDEELRLVDMALLSLRLSSISESERLQEFIQQHCKGLLIQPSLKNPIALFVAEICLYIATTPLLNFKGHAIAINTLNFILSKIHSANLNYTTESNDNNSTSNTEKAQLDWQQALLEKVSETGSGSLLKNSHHLRNRMINTLAKATQTYYLFSETDSIEQKCAAIREGIKKLRDSLEPDVDIFESTPRKKNDNPQTDVELSTIEEVSTSTEPPTLKEEISEILTTFMTRNESNHAVQVAYLAAEAYRSGLEKQPDDELLLLINLADQTTGLGGLNLDEIRASLRALIKKYSDKYSKLSTHTDDGLFKRITAIFLNYLIKSRITEWESKKQIALKFIQKLISDRQKDRVLIVEKIILEMIPRPKEAQIFFYPNLSECRELTKNLREFIQREFESLGLSHQLAGCVFNCILEKNDDYLRTSLLLAKMHHLIEENKDNLIKHISSTCARLLPNHPSESEFNKLFGELQTDTLRLLLAALTTMQPEQASYEKSLSKALSSLINKQISRFSFGYLSQNEPHYTVITTVIRFMVNASSTQEKEGALNYLITLLQRQRTIEDDNRLTDANNNNQTILSDKSKIAKWEKMILDDIETSSTLANNKNLHRELLTALEKQYNPFAYITDDNIKETCTALRKRMNLNNLKSTEKENDASDLTQSDAVNTNQALPAQTHDYNDPFLNEAAQNAYIPWLFWKREKEDITRTDDYVIKRVISPFEKRQ